MIADKSTEYYTERKSNVYIQRGEVTLAVNEFAKEKTGNMLLAMKRFYKLSLQSRAGSAGTNRVAGKEAGGTMCFRFILPDEEGR